MVGVYRAEYRGEGGGGEKLVLCMWSGGQGVKQTETETENREKE